MNDNDNDDENDNDVNKTSDEMMKIILMKSETMTKPM